MKFASALISLALLLGAASAQSLKGGCYLLAIYVADLQHRSGTDGR